MKPVSNATVRSLPRNPSEIHQKSIRNVDNTNVLILPPPSWETVVRSIGTCDNDEQGRVMHCPHIVGLVQRSTRHKSMTSRAMRCPHLVERPRHPSTRHQSTTSMLIRCPQQVGRQYVGVVRCCARCCCSTAATLVDPVVSTPSSPPPPLLKAAERSSTRPTLVASL